jgi:hypothetical protein
MTAEVLPDQGYHTAMWNQIISDKTLLQWDPEQGGPYVMSLRTQLHETIRAMVQCAT